MQIRHKHRLAFLSILFFATVLFVPVYAATAFPQTEATATLLEQPQDKPEDCTFCATSPSQQGSPTSDKMGEIPIRLRAGAFDPLLQSMRDNLVVAAYSQPEATEGALRLIQFPGPIQDRWYKALTDAGLDIVAYIPDYTYLVWGSERKQNAVRSTVPVRWSGLYQPAYAVHPALQSLAKSESFIDVVVQFYTGAGTKALGATLIAKASNIVRPAQRVLSYTNLYLKIAGSDVLWFAAQPGVVSVEPLLQPVVLDEIQGQIMAGHLVADGSSPAGPGYLTWLTATVGMTTTPGAYPIVDITDDGIDDGDATPNHPDFYTFGDPLNDDRLIYNANWTSDSKADGVGGHGNLNASIVGGYNDGTGAAFEDGDGYNYGLGIHPFARIAGSKVFGNTSGWSNPVYADVLAYGYTQGARISSNSWGDDVGNGQYQTDDQIYDMLVRDAAQATTGNQEMTILFSAGNSGSLLTTIGSPANAKNVITVGASESYRPTWIDGCGIGPTGTNNANDIAVFSSRGPTADGRIKPDVVAPGTHIIGAASQVPNYTGDYVCDRYQPTGQTLYAASSGTSHAVPAVAGAASLFYRYFQDYVGDTGSWPSPAMAKAALINSARYLDGVSSGDTLPSPHQGFGSVNLGTVLDSTPRLVEDQTKIFRDSGEFTTIRGYISDTNRPFRITLAWTDAPGIVTGDSYVNDLDLSVNVEGTIYLGNVFSGAFSTSGGTADTRNNVESIFLPAGLQGSFEITIKATNIAGDGVPGNGDLTDQDYALICYNCVRTDTFMLEISPLGQTICAGEDAVYDIASTNYAAHPLSIALSAGGYPPTSTAAFVPNPILAGGTSVLTVTNTAKTQSGNYAITVTGETLTRTQVVTSELSIYKSVPGTTYLVSPLHMAVDIPLHPTLNWAEVAQTDLYAVEIATDTAFTTLVYSAVTEKVTHTVQIGLAPETDYYWRVIPRNICGDAVPAEPRLFTTRAASFWVTSSPALTIPDNNFTGISDTITVTDPGLLIDMDVAISITHSWVGDLAVTLEHLETGTLIDLVNRPGVTNPDTDLGCSGMDMDNILDDGAPLAVEDNCQNTMNAYPAGARYSPNEPLALFNGETWQGTWRIRVSDHASMDTGILHQWGLIPTLDSSGHRTINFSQDSYSVTKTETTAAITVTLGGTPVSTVTVGYSTAPGSALPGEDYITATGVLTFTAASQQSFLVPVLNNPSNEVSRTLTVALHDPVGAMLTAPYTAPLHILAEPKKYYFYLQFVLRR
ncbi:MAG: S8 family serine peptidase [Anaerolineae bacterium]|nr:S8 family serine peptidase [Anaerolineae bacterium]